MGDDRQVKKCFGSTIDVTQFFLLSGITSRWNIPDSAHANIGTHRLIVTNQFGCKDTVLITVTDNPKPEIGANVSATICPTGDPINLNAIFTLTGLNYEWNTPTPTATQAKGVYELIVQNEFGCKDTAYYEVKHFETPEFLRDTTIGLCFGKTKDLNTIYTIPPGYSLVDWSTTTPATAGAGNHIITVEDNLQGCHYTAIVHIDVAADNVEQLFVCNYNMSTTNGVFTTNTFRTITVDKRGQVWAGSTNGLYRFNRLNALCFSPNTWEKFTPASGISTVTNTYRDLQPSNVVGDTSIWAASIGNTLPYNFTGGVDHITGFNNPVVHYGSVNGGSMGGGLSSRNGNSIALSSTHKIYAALGFSLQERLNLPDSVLDGGTFVNNMQNPATAFTAVPLSISSIDNRFFAAGVRKNEVWFGYDNINNGVTANRIQKWNDVTGTQAGFVDENNSPIPFGAGLEVRAILTDSVGRTFVGLNGGHGIAVLDSAADNPTWTMVTSANTVFPVGATINYNAITQVLDEIWVGTSKGLMVYNGIGSLTDCASWKLYTTANNLPSNNITDIAFDYNTFETWLTSDAGVSKLALTPSITGIVVNVNAGRYDALLPALNKTPLQNAEVKLIQTSGLLNGVVIDTKTTNATGSFEFDNVKPFTRYSIEVRYTGQQQYYYRYTDLKYNSTVGQVLIPDSLRKEMDTLRLKMEKNRFDFELYGYKIDTVILIDEILRIADGYLMDKYKDPFNFIDTSLIKTDHSKRINNIANYYLVLANIYKIGLKASDFKLKQYGAFFDAIQSLGAFTKLGTNLNYHSRFGGEPNKKSAFLRATLQLAAIKVKSTINELLTSASAIDADWKKSVDEYSPYLNAAIDGLVNVIVNGDGGTIVNESIEIVKKGLVVFLGKKDYTSFCREFHKDIIKNMALQATYLQSDRKYEDVFKLLSKELPAPGDERSVTKLVSDTALYYDSLITQLVNNAKLGDAIQGVLGTAAALAPVIGATVGAGFGGAGAIPGGAIGVAAAEILVIVQKAVQVFNSAFLFKAAYRGWQGNKVLRQQSKYVVPNSGFSILAFNLGNRLQGDGQQAQHLTASLDSLVAKKNRYNQAITQLNALQLQPYDSAAYYTSFNSFIIHDSAYTKEIEASLNQIWPVAKNATENISGYGALLDTAINEKLLQQLSLRQSYNIGCYAYQAAPAYPGLVNSMDSLANVIKLKNNAATTALQDLVSISNSNNITAPAYLVQTNYDLKFSNRPDSSGILTYTLQNIGSVTQNNVTALMGQPTAGFNVTSVAYINLGNIAPGQSKQITYRFTAPPTDTIGQYEIQILANNGVYNNISGSWITELPKEYISVANGLWSNPDTWSSHTVPTAESEVTVKHNVDVDITTAECKSIKAIAPGLLKVKAGMKLKVNK